MIVERIPGSIRSATALAVLLTVVADAEAQQAGITKIVIDSKESPAYGGRTFGEVGQYEILRGRALGEVHPENPGNTGIVYIDKAPRNARGNVEYDVDLVIIKPIDMARGNQTLFYSVNNRGRVPFNNADDGFLMRHGFTLVWSGWHADVPKDAIRARFPVAKNVDGSPIRKWISTEFGVGDLGIGFPPIYTASPVRPYLDDFYPVVEESKASAVLMRRQGPHGEPQIIPRDQWSFASCPGGAKGTPSNMDICVPAGFSGDYIYQLIYEAQDPRVQGLGFAATRDLVSFLRHDTSNANPLVRDSRNPIRWTMAYGVSQSGRYLRHLLYEGFNADTGGRIVFDGLLPHIAGGRRGFFNQEFTQTTRYSRAVEEHFYPEDGFPFAYEVQTDPITGKTDGLLTRCRQSQTCPKIMHSDDASEFWQGRSSLVLTDPLGKRDMPLPENVRFYLHPSTSHTPASDPEDRGMCEYLKNPNRNQETLHALHLALQAWIAEGKEPPPSRYPRISDGTLVGAAEVRFPNIPGVRYTAQYNHKFVNDYSTLPARHVPGTEYGVLVPQVDKDGNDIAGIRSAGLQTPTATYTGWNLRATGFMAGSLCVIDGSSFPFAPTPAERGSGDPRPSLKERYGSHAGYLEAFRKGSATLLREGFLLQEDYDRLVAKAEKEELGLPR
jgi:hypothetical protein